jgi:hypothetical protein
MNSGRPKDPSNKLSRERLGPFHWYYELLLAISSVECQYTCLGFRQTLVFEGNYLRSRPT